MSNKGNMKGRCAKSALTSDREGGKECPYYMRIGSCKFATNCRFHHPDPSNVVSRDPMLEHENGDIPQQNVQASSQLNVPVWSADQRALNEHCAPFLAPASSYSAGMIPPRGMYPSPEWSGYHQVPLGPYYPPGIAFHHFPTPVNHPMYRGADVPGHQELPSDEYPERPGQLECQHFVKSGFCKFKAKCKYHHPRSLVPPPTAGALSPLGLPLRSDQPVCTYYERYGVCKFGPACIKKATKRTVSFQNYGFVKSETDIKARERRFKFCFLNAEASTSMSPSRNDNFSSIISDNYIHARSAKGLRKTCININLKEF
ncbi:Zinc finger CCCH domain-containing protein 65 [Triticum urartu]|uniref:Zinc finger CCCH domain-containing protein 65 n=1 Tax=Triticum urartu TaxID=4572 RepID=M7YAZ7_TRIUA|nr:Zinc finger CCCH domain-containing protein 65 [Triticum urartu]